MSHPAPSSYGRILKTSALLGGASLINVALGIVRVKVVAVHLGPGLYGLMGLYGSFLGIVGAAVGLGIGQSAVREMAEAEGKSDEAERAHVIIAIRRLAWITGVFGLLITLVLAWPASFWTFGNGEHAWAFVALSVTVLLGQISMGQTVVLQGLRRIRDLTSISILGAVLGTVLSIPILLWLGERGIVPFLLAVSVGGVVVSWWYARRVRTDGFSQSWRETWRRSTPMVSLGVVLIIGLVFSLISNYLVRLIIQSHVGEVGVGLYQSAFMLSGQYVGFILGAMTTDYYPRLTAVVQDRDKANRLVNEQTDMALLMGVPGLVAAIVLADAVIWAFYSSRFAGAPEILRWTVLGLFGQIIAWPLGYILLARSDRKAFFWTELSAWSLQVVMTFVLVRAFGTVGAGMAFAGLYAFHSIVVYLVCKHRHGFELESRTVNLMVAGGLLVGGAFAANFISSTRWRYPIEAMIALASVGFSMIGMYQCLGRDRIGAMLMNLQIRLGLVKPSWESA